MGVYIFPDCSGTCIKHDVCHVLLLDRSNLVANEILEWCRELVFA